MSEQAGTTTETTAKAESPYWIGRHKRGFLTSLATLGVVSTGLFTWISHNQARDNADAYAQALRKDRACERVIDEKAGPKANTAIVRLGALTARQQVDCGVDGIISTKNVGGGYGEPRLLAKTIDATVELPSRQALHAAQRQDLKESQTSEWNDLPFDIGMGMVGVPLMGFIVTAWMSGDAFTYNRRPATPHREQTTISA